MSGPDEPRSVPPAESEAPETERPADEPRADGERRGPHGPGLRSRVARRILGAATTPDGRPPEEGASSTINAREVLGAMLETGDKARYEVYRIVAREVRSYLDALQIWDGLHHLMTNYSLEVNASFSLKPLAKKVPRPPEPAPADTVPPPRPDTDEDDD